MIVKLLKERCTRKKTFLCIITSLVLVIGIFPIFAQASIETGHSKTYWISTTCKMCGGADSRVKYGCTGNFKMAEAAKTCTNVAGCQSQRQQYYTCYRHMSEDLSRTYCHSDYMDYNIHKTTHTLCGTTGGCQYKK